MRFGRFFRIQRWPTRMDAQLADYTVEGLFKAISDFTVEGMETYWIFIQWLTEVFYYFDLFVKKNRVTIENV